jgi:DHA2 family methylenomycin A resistance protein-like MFS transporter
MAMAMTPTTAAAMGSVPVDKAGVGSGVLNSMRQVGGSLGVAISGAILGSYSTYVAGFQAALHVAAGIAFAASIVAFVTVRKPSHQRQVAVEMG